MNIDCPYCQSITKNAVSISSIDISTLVETHEKDINTKLLKRVYKPLI